VFDGGLCDFNDVESSGSVITEFVSFIVSDRNNIYQDVLVKNRARSEADHSPPSSADVKNSWRYTSTPQYVFMA
jgi:hypothetical protein